MFAPVRSHLVQSAIKRVSRARATSFGLAANAVMAKLAANTKAPPAAAARKYVTDMDTRLPARKRDCQHVSCLGQAQVMFATEAPGQENVLGQRVHTRI